MRTKNSPQREYEFRLVLTGAANIDDAAMNALYEAGCSDATPSVRFGRLYLTFARKAESLRAAVLSAIRDVIRARTGAAVTCVDDCNLVSQADIARRIARSRQLVGQYISGQRGPGGFPGPVCDLAEGHPLWHWCEVAHWLWKNGIVADDVLKDSRDIAVINSVLDLVHQREHDPPLAEEVFDIVRQSTEPTAGTCI